MKRLRRTDRSGFTLVELMIVIAILGILAALAIPGYLRFLAKARRAEMVSTLAGIFTTETAYYTGNDVFKGGSDDCSGPPDAWSRNLTIGQEFSLAGASKYYGFCLELLSPPTAYFARAYGNIDYDPYYDFGYVTELNRGVIILQDDVVN